MSAKTSTIHIRVDDDIKDPATQALASGGSVDVGCCASFLSRVVVNQALPLELKEPNAETQAAIEVSRMMLSKRKARFVNADALLAYLENRSRK